jgi:hypothetical protein
MPPLAVDVLREPPPWTVQWEQRGRVAPGCASWATSS